MVSKNSELFLVVPIVGVGPVFGEYFESTICRAQLMTLQRVAGSNVVILHEVAQINSALSSQQDL